jgi:anti-sigma factor ChrR (cupin superfamily)
MQHANLAERESNDATVAAVASVLDMPFDRQEPEAAAARKGLLGHLLRWLHDRVQAERQRRELTQMGGRDFGDLTIPSSLIRDELRRWPWQKSSPQWDEVTVTRRGRRAAIVWKFPDWRRAAPSAERRGPRRAVKDCLVQIGRSGRLLF